MSNKRKVHTTFKRVFDFWKPWLVALGKLDWDCEYIEKCNRTGKPLYWCFACGFAPREHKPQRAHIVPDCEGGPDEPANLHLLCFTCHKDSEMLTGDVYERWLRARTSADTAMSLAIRYKGLLPTDLIRIARGEIDYKLLIRLPPDMAEMLVGHETWEALQ